MRIPRRWVEAYSRSLNAVSDRGRAELVARLAGIDFSRPVAEVRGEVAAVMRACCGASSTMAARLAADFYDRLRSEFDISDGWRATVDGGYEPEATDGAVRAFVQDLVDGKPVEAFVGKCADRLDREVRLSANKCVERNARRDPKKPRWARVPTGPETCEFCIMLASRGFVYRNEDVASHAHAHCDCRVVPSWDKAKAEVEGYDPNLYYDMWKHPENHPAGSGATSTGSGQPQPPSWAGALNVSYSTRRCNLPSGQSGVTYRSTDCDVFTTQDGIEVIFPQGMDPTVQPMTPQHAIELLDRVPDRIRRNMQRRVFFVDYENQNDAYWRQVYANFTQSYATGGDEIVFYRYPYHDDDYVVRTYCHEAGHYIDRQNGNVSSSQEYQQAKADDEANCGNAHPTLYAGNSDTEDFAESVALWATDYVNFSVDYPNRTSIIEGTIP